MRVRLDFRCARRARHPGGSWNTAAADVGRRAVEALAQSLTQLGARLMLGAQVESVTRDDEGLVVRVDGEELRPALVLHAVGRAGNVECLGLAEAGVAVDDRGRIRVDSNFQTTAQGIYAAGDITGPAELASVAMEQARVAMCRAFEIPFKDSLDAVVPTGIYTLPEAAMVGLTEEAADSAARTSGSAGHTSGQRPCADRGHHRGPGKARVPRLGPPADRRTHPRRGGDRTDPHRSGRASQARAIDEFIDTTSTSHPRRRLQVRGLRRAPTPAGPRRRLEARWCDPLRSCGRPSPRGNDADG